MENVLEFHTPIFSTKWHMQTTADPDQKEQSDQSLLCLPFH